MAQVLMLELLHQLDQLRVDIVEAPHDALGPRDLVPALGDAVARLELADDSACRARRRLLRP